MQSIWSRIGKPGRPSNCSQCLSTTSSCLSRRPTTSTARRRLLLPSSSATFVYSAIFATAAIADAALKDQRSRQWDRAISKAKEDLATVDHTLGDVRPVVTEEGQDCYQNQDVLRDAASDIALESCEPCVSEPLSPWDNKTSDHKHPQTVIKWEPLQEYIVAPETTQQEFPPRTGQRIRNRNCLPPESIWATNVIKRKAERKHWTDKKVRVSELAAANIILTLSNHHLLPFWREKPSGEGGFQSLQRFRQDSVTDFKAAEAAIFDEIEVAQNNLDVWDVKPPNPLPVPLPSYCRDGDFNHIMPLRELNDTLLRLFEKYQVGELSLSALLARICNALFESQAPPDVHTFNILLIQFAQMKLNRAVWRLVQMMKKVMIRPNEITCATVLAHFTRLRDVKSFVGYIQLMRGHRGGLMLARGNVTITEVGRTRLFWNEKGKLVQKVNQMPIILDAIIGGLLQFVGFKETLKVCADLKNDGWGLDMRCLTTLLHNCAVRQDWENGTRIWEQVWLTSERFRATITITVYSTMLYLCKCCNKAEEFHRIFAEATTYGHKPEDLIDMIVMRPPDKIIRKKLSLNLKLLKNQRPTVTEWNPLYEWSREVGRQDPEGRPTFSPIPQFEKLPTRVHKWVESVQFERSFKAARSNESSISNGSTPSNEAAVSKEASISNEPTVSDEAAVSDESTVSNISIRYHLKWMGEPRPPPPVLARTSLRDEAPLEMMDPSERTEAMARLEETALSAEKARLEDAARHEELARLGDEAQLEDAAPLENATQLEAVASLDDVARPEDAAQPQKSALLLHRDL